MKKIGLIILIILCLNTLYSFDTIVRDEIDSIENVISDSNNVIDTKHEVSKENLYDYNQLFMFGFLVLGAILVVWKFSGRGKY